MRGLLAALFCFTVLSPAAFAQDDHNDAGPILGGYAVVTLTGAESLFGSGGRVVAFGTLGFRSEASVSQSGVLAASMTTRMAVFATVGINLPRNVGVGVTNPGSADALVTMALRRADGSLSSVKTVTVPARRQVARYISEFFTDSLEIQNGFDGTLTLLSSAPVAVVAFRFLGTKFSTIPVTSLSPSVGVPEMPQGIGGERSSLLPRFMANGRWTSEIVLLNVSTGGLRVRVDLFTEDGAPLETRLNNQSGSSFQNLYIAPGGMLVLSPRNASGESDF